MGIVTSFVVVVVRMGSPTLGILKESGGDCVAVGAGDDCCDGDEGNQTLVASCQNLTS